MIPQTIGRAHRNVVGEDDRRKEELRAKEEEDSIAASDEDDDDRDNRHFIAMDQLNKETRGSRATSAQTDIKKVNNAERGKKTNDTNNCDFDDRVHRPSDPLLTTSTKMTGI